jgi:hypothetical protein
MVNAGKRGPQGRPSGAGLEGPLLPWQPPNTLGQSTKKRSVIQGAPGTDQAIPPTRRPMAWAGRASSMAVATEAMQQQHGIVGGAIELAPALPGQGEGTKAAPQFEI